MTSYPWSIFVVSARLFFIDIPLTWFGANLEDGFDVPWSSWGPHNSRCFLLESDRPGASSEFGVGGSRVIRVVNTRMHMANFNPSAVARGIGNVVREPTTILKRSMDSFTEDVTTYLPYVEVVNNDRNFDHSLCCLKLDEEKIVLFTRTNTATVSVFVPVEPMKIDHLSE
jgi:hypothetical protein